MATDPFLKRLAAELIRVPSAPPAQTGHMTWNKLASLIRAGYGQGHLEKYLPWRTVSKRDVSKQSNMSHLPAPEFGHKHHPRSRAQRNLLNTLAWMGAYDVRDHYPLWPWNHAHPIVGLPGMPHEMLTRGTYEIGSECEILPAPYPGLQLPRIVSIHALATMVDPEKGYRLFAFQIDSSNDIPLTELTRTGELNLLRGRYFSEANIPFRLVPERAMRTALSTNLDAIRPKMTRKVIDGVRQGALYDRVVKCCLDNAYHSSPSHVIEALSRQVPEPVATLWDAFNVARWFQDIDIDLASPIEPWNPLVPGGVALREALRAYLLRGRSTNHAA